MKIHIKAPDVEVRKGVGKNGPWEMMEQTGYLHTEDEVRKIRVPLGRSQSPYAVGVYDVDVRSFKVNDYGDLVIGRLVLTPVSARPAAAKVA